MALDYFTGPRGVIGTLLRITSGGETNAGVIPAVTLADASGAAAGGAVNPIVTALPADQDPIYDHANGTKTSVTASATIITPPAACKFLRISTDVDLFVNAAGATAVDDGTSIRIVANSPEVIPVTAAVAVKALSSSGTAVVRCTPMKVR